MTSRRPSARLLLLAALAGAAASSQPASAESPLPDASSSASSAPSKLPFAAYAWPTEVGPEPAEADWAGATALQSGGPEKPISEWSPNFADTVCNHEALGAWLRITCWPRVNLIGSIWGLGGDVAKVKATFVLKAERDHPTTPVVDNSEHYLREMGVSTTITLPVTPGSATLLQVDAISVGRAVRRPWSRRHGARLPHRRLVGPRREGSDHPLPLSALTAAPRARGTSTPSTDTRSTPRAASLPPGPAGAGAARTGAARGWRRARG